MQPEAAALGVDAIPRGPIPGGAAGTSSLGKLDDGIRSFGAFDTIYEALSSAWPAMVDVAMFLCYRTSSAIS